MKTLLVIWLEPHVCTGGSPSWDGPNENNYLLPEWFLYVFKKICFLSLAPQLMTHYQLIKSHVNFIWVPLLHSTCQLTPYSYVFNRITVLINGENEASWEMIWNKECTHERQISMHIQECNINFHFITEAIVNNAAVNTGVCTSFWCVNKWRSSMRIVAVGCHICISLLLGKGITQLGFQFPWVVFQMARSST